MAQFTCSICGDGFEQKSRLQRHIETSHPPQAPSAANVEKVLGGIEYPKTKDELVQYSSQKVSIIGKDLFDLINSLPSRTYRDSAEVAMALGELKSGKAIRDAAEVEATSPVKIAAACRPSLSKKKEQELCKEEHTKVNSTDSNKILDILNRLPDIEYRIWM